VEAAISRGTRELRTAAHHLQGGQVLLPPEVLLVLWTHGREHVVGVHHDVDEGVEQAEEGAVATWGELNAEYIFLISITRRDLAIVSTQTEAIGMKPYKKSCSYCSI